ncbi:MAG: 1-deoxy-D-xylulose-5-phosphate synthase [Spirochaetia bacterium]|nr:1-deoxy-D-xylulose-5-phosphate synthase [Spirochaetota bacterium]MCX8096844.1 1-deoxy-D-xylulose-5-phosphate synthase [Spirochaetota bacterium]MDW8111778.1 1-deoxy-D-xylulose-5-phosphate synthase [Spirochaetia bacterium]
MNRLLDLIDYPSDLKKVDVQDLPKLCDEIREFLIENVSKTGGHFAPSLGVVELSVALHYIFEMPKDKIIWDVGHQAYVHKILTGRKNRFGELRKYRGLYGYLKPSESEYDIVHAGHSSTSLAIAQGISEGNKIIGKKDENIVAVIGDGAMTAGMAYEAINNIGFYRSNLIIILNDNGMSISPNVGAITHLFNKLMMTKASDAVRRYVSSNGSITKKVFLRFLESVKSFFLPKSVFFDEIGVRYIGPFDGHNVLELVELIRYLKDESDKPILAHVITQKGKGYKFAEEDPVKYHSVPVFDPKVGVPDDVKKQVGTYSEVFSNKVVEIGQKNEKVVCITPAMKEGSGLIEFAEKFPGRFYDVAIAEQHGCTFSLGLSISGVIPIYAIYSTFLQRAYDQVIHDVSIFGKHVVFAIDRAGIVGNDGETHQGIFDISFLKQLPNFVIMAPSTGKDLERMLDFSLTLNQPVAIRYPKDKCNPDSLLNGNQELVFGKSRLIYDSDDVFIVSVGHMLKYAVEAREILKDKNIDVGIVDLVFIKPLDMDMINRLSTAKVVVTIEDGVKIGGIGETIGVELYKNGFRGKFDNIGLPDSFPGLGTRDEIFRDYGMNSEGISKTIMKLLKEDYTSSLK